MTLISLRLNVLDCVSFINLLDVSHAGYILSLPYTCLTSTLIVLFMLSFLLCYYINTAVCCVNLLAPRCSILAIKVSQRFVLTIVIYNCKHKDEQHKCKHIFNHDDTLVDVSVSVNLVILVSTTV
jgi:hypothetical protein